MLWWFEEKWEYFSLYTHDIYVYLQAWAFMAPLISWPLLRQSSVTVYTHTTPFNRVDDPLLYICWMMMMWCSLTYIVQIGTQWLLRARLVFRVNRLLLINITAFVLRSSPSLANSIYSAVVTNALTWCLELHFIFFYLEL